MAAGVALLADAAAVEATRALETAGIPSILLRGPVVARHLYGHDEIRPYMDADLLVQRDQRGRSEEVLRNLGFEHVAVLGQRSSDRPPWSSTWERPRDRANVDLHWTLIGVGASPEEVWRVFEETAERVPVRKAQLRGLGEAATALVVALHAAHHGALVGYPIDDLQRAIQRLPFGTWEAATELASRLDASEAFAAGLHLAPGGAALARRLQLPDVRTTETLLRAQTAPPTALGFDWLARTPGVRRKVIFVAAKWSRIGTSCAPGRRLLVIEDAAALCSPMPGDRSG